MQRNISLRLLVFSQQTTDNTNSIDLSFQNLKHFTKIIHLSSIVYVKNPTMSISSKFNKAETWRKLAQMPSQTSVEGAKRDLFLC